jgi:type IV pilus assembly protein PilM
MHPLLINYFNLIKKFIPEKAPGTAVGLDIGSSECKMVEIFHTGEKFELRNWAIEAIVNGDVAGVIQKILKKLEDPPKTVYTAVLGKGTLIRYIDMPRMSLEDLRNAFGVETDKYFPFPPDQIYTDCYILNSQGKEKQMTVLAAAAKKELVDERVKLLQGAGLSTDFIGINSVALTKVVHVLGPGQNCPPDAKNIVVLDMGDTVSNLSILVDRVPRFNRDIFVGGREFTKQIANAFSVGVQEAEVIKIQPGDKLEKVQAAVESAVMNIAREIRFSLDYFAAEDNHDAQAILLTGGGAMLPDIPQIFSNVLEMPAFHWNPLELLSYSENIAPEMVKKTGMKFGVALGLALCEYD